MILLNVAHYTSPRPGAQVATATGKCLHSLEQTLTTLSCPRSSQDAITFTLALKAVFIESALSGDYTGFTNSCVLRLLLSHGVSRSQTPSHQWITTTTAHWTHPTDGLQMSAPSTTCSTLLVNIHAAVNTPLQNTATHLLHFEIHFKNFDYGSSAIHSVC